MIARVASTPSITGIWRSMRMRSNVSPASSASEYARTA